MFKKRRLWLLRMWIKRTIDANLTVYVKQSHKTCNAHLDKVAPKKASANGETSVMVAASNICDGKPRQSHCSQV